MIPLVSVPDLITRYGQAYQDLFSNAGYGHFLRYLSGLLINSNKTVSGIAKSFALDGVDQSTLNRFLTQGRYDLDELNQRRVDTLQAHSRTQMKGEGKLRGVLGLDDTLLSHYGQHFDHIKVLWDHTEHRNVWAHNLVTLYYGDEHVDYPLYFKLWEPADAQVIEEGLEELGVKLQSSKLSLKETAPSKWLNYLKGVCQRRRDSLPAINQLYKDKVAMGMELISEFDRQYPDLDLAITFDSWYTTPRMCGHIDQLGRKYVGALKIEKSSLMRPGSHYAPLAEFIEQIKQAHLKGPKELFEEVTVKRRGKSYTTYCYCRTHHLKNYGRVRLMISFSEADLSDSPRAYISNQINWQAATISRIYRHRWPIEPFHQQAKAQGLGKYQIRDFKAIQRHILFVITVFSILTLARKDTKALRELRIATDATEQSLAFWQRLIQAQAFIALVHWIKHGIDKALSMEQICEPLLQTFQIS